MKKLLTIFFALVLGGASVLAEPTLQEFYNDLYDYTTSEEENLATRTDATARDFEVKIEKLRYQLYQLRKDNTLSEAQKASKKKALARELEYYEMRLDQLK